MRVAVSILRWFEYGGLQRDCARVLAELVDRGHEVRLYSLRFEAPVPDGVLACPVAVQAWTNHGAVVRFADAVAAALAEAPADVHVGFNKLPGLDVYFAGDSCFLHKALTQRPRWYRWLPRFRTLAALEAAVMAPPSVVRVLAISAVQAEQFRQLYNTPCERLALMPPGIARNRLAGPDAEVVRSRVREQFGVAADDNTRLLLFIGSGFRKKGLDRAIEALASLPDTRLLVAGLDRPDRYRRLAERVGVGQRVVFLGPRDDVPDLLLGADVLVHPARDEAGGIVLVEALAAGLPVVATDVCGFAEHVRAADAGVVLPSPYNEARLVTAINTLLAPGARERFGAAGHSYASQHDLYSLPQRVVDEIETQAQVAS